MSIQDDEAGLPERGDAAGGPEARGPAAPSPDARGGDVAASSRIGAATPSRAASGAAIVALVAFAWGMSLLVQEWLRLTWLEPRGLSTSLLAAPLFAAAVTAGLLAVQARVAGRPAVGGPMAHRFGLASGLVGATALVLSLYMGPRLLQMQEGARLARARLQLQEIVVVLEAHATDEGAYPEGAGARALDPLASRFDDGRVPARDPWGHELEYRSLAGGRGYLLLSPGPDGEVDLPLSDYIEGPPGVPVGDDLVVVNGAFRGEPAPAARLGDSVSSVPPATTAPLPVDGGAPPADANIDAGEREAASPADASAPGAADAPAHGEGPR